MKRRIKMFGQGQAYLGQQAKEQGYDGDADAYYSTVTITIAKPDSSLEEIKRSLASRVESIATAITQGEVTLMADKEDGKKTDTKETDSMLSSVLEDMSRTGGDKEFLIPASDNKGQSRQTIFRQQPGWSNQVENIVSSKELPFDTPSAFYRFAVVHAIRYFHQCRSLPEKTQGLLCKLLAIDEVARDEEIRNMVDASMSSMSRYILERKKAGDITGAKELYNKVHSLISAIHDPREKKRYVDRVERQLGSLLKGTGPASFDPAHFGDEDRPEEEQED